MNTTVDKLAVNMTWKGIFERNNAWFQEQLNLFRATTKVFMMYCTTSGIFGRPREHPSGSISSGNL